MVHSAGTHALPGKKTTDTLLQLAKQKGINLEAHRSRQLTPLLIEKADIIIVMELAHQTFITLKSPESKNKVFLLSDFHPLSVMVPPQTNIPDPIGMSDFFYENVNEMIRLCCQGISTHLMESYNQRA